MKIVLEITDPETVISDLRSVVRTYRSGETTVHSSPISNRLSILATRIEAEVALWRRAHELAAEIHAQMGGTGPVPDGVVTPVTVGLLRGGPEEMPGGGSCYICDDPDDHNGQPHGQATGDGRTRDDVLHLPMYEFGTDEPCGYLIVPREHVVEAPAPEEAI